MTQNEIKVPMVIPIRVTADTANRMEIAMEKAALQQYTLASTTPIIVDGNTTEVILTFTFNLVAKRS